jgi:REP element-mobilizing transposase RayT
MPRKARLEFDGAVYHLLDRGDRREAIFRDDRDREMFLATLGRVCERTGWRVHAWVLMTNHYHLLVETPQANLVAGMRWFQTTYTVRFNRRHRLSGHLFQGRYKAVVVNPEEERYFVILSDYIHLNPVRARMISLQERLFDFLWSSYRWYVTRSGRPEWFEAGRVLGELGLEDSASGRKRYAERMRGRAVDEMAERNAAQNEGLRRGWCLGEASFRERMLSLLETTGEKFSRGREIDGAVRRNHDANEARRVLLEAMTCFGMNESELARLRRSDSRKLAIARLIRKRTSVPNRWIVRELSLGHVSNVSRYCSEAVRNGVEDDKLRKWFESKKE